MAFLNLFSGQILRIKVIDFVMTGRRRLSDLDRGRALGLLQSGLSVREVGRRLEVSHSVIQRLNQRFMETGSVRDRQRSGRPRITDARDDRCVVLAALRERRTSARVLRQHLRDTRNVNVSTDTIRRRLREQGIRARRPAVRPVLTRAHRAARLAWCRRHLGWRRQEWARVLFSDESRFTISFCDGRERVWRRSGERYNDSCVIEHNRFGGGSVMVWAGIGIGQRTPLQRVMGNMNAISYRDDILTPVVIPALQAIGEGAIFQDDNARAHRARIINDYLNTQQVTHMDWPANSPDLNPIEHVWDILGRRLRENHPSPANQDQLFNFLEQEWQHIPQNEINRLIMSMRRRCLACINSRGGHTAY